MPCPPKPICEHDRNHMPPILPARPAPGRRFNLSADLKGDLFDQLLFNRPFPGYAQYRMPVRNLYMCGSSTHPGGGVSSACGANAAREILMDLRRPNTVPEDDFYDE